jgi:hypothetical protein
LIKKISFFFASKNQTMMNLLVEEKRVSEEERLEVKVRRGRKREEDEDDERLVFVLGRSGECVGGDRTDIVV